MTCTKTIQNDYESVIKIYQEYSDFCEAHAISPILFGLNWMPHWMRLKEKTLQVGKIEQLTTSPITPEVTLRQSTFKELQELNITRLKDTRPSWAKFGVLIENVEGWAAERGIFSKATPLSQHKKTQEEVDELKEALETNNKEEIIDAIGDIIVTLIIQAKMNNVDVIDCLETAYNVIKNRTGVMKDGLFVKDNKNGD